MLNDLVLHQVVFVTLTQVKKYKICMWKYFSKQIRNRHYKNIVSKVFKMYTVVSYISEKQKQKIKTGILGVVSAHIRVLSAVMSLN